MRQAIKILMVLFSCSLASVACAFQVQISEFEGEFSGLKRPLAVVLPDAYSPQSNLPVVYVLHGYGGDHESYLKSTDIARYADVYNLILVFPDGGKSWYVDSPIRPHSRFETYIAKDLVAYIDKYYSTVKSSKSRAITGFSMGGFGAFSIGLNHLNTFNIIVSTSGGVDIQPFPTNWKLDEVFGSFDSHQEAWRQVAIANRLQPLHQRSNSASPIAISFDVGVNDFFLSVNRKLHQAMIDLKIPHDYAEREGRHDTNYLNRSLEYQMLFISNQFNANKENP